MLIQFTTLVNVAEVFRYSWSLSSEEDRYLFLRQPDGVIFQLHLQLKLLSRLV